MNCSVNLVPAARLTTRTRRHRRSAWIATSVVVCGLLGGAVLLHRTAEGALQRLSKRVDEIEQQRATTQRQLVTAETERVALLQQLQIVAGAKHTQPWARRLTKLTQAAPDGTCLTTIEIGATAAQAAGGTRNRARPTTGELPAGKPEAGESSEQIVRLSGYAIDHGALIQLLNIIQTLPGWGQAELVRATSERGAAVTFELSCATQEEQP